MPTVSRPRWPRARSGAEIEVGVSAGGVLGSVVRVAMKAIAMRTATP